VFDRVAKGVYTAIALYCEHYRRGDKIALAFPDTDHFRKYLMSIMPALNELAISVYVVSPDRQAALL
jgi:hypothetical protein